MQSLSCADSPEAQQVRSNFGGGAHPDGSEISTDQMAHHAGEKRTAPEERKQDKSERRERERKVGREKDTESER